MPSNNAGQATATLHYASMFPWCACYPLHARRKRVGACVHPTPKFAATLRGHGTVTCLPPGDVVGSPVLEDTGCSGFGIVELPLEEIPRTLSSNDALLEHRHGIRGCGC